MEALFEKADFSTWERAEHFLYFRDRIKCRYTLNAEVDVTRLMEFRLDRGLKFFPLFLHVIMRAVNRSREFRMAYDSDGSPGWWSVVVPSYTIFHADDHTFSDIWSDYHENRMIFYDAVRADMETYREVKGLCARPRASAEFLFRLRPAVAALHIVFPRLVGGISAAFPADPLRQVRDKSRAHGAARGGLRTPRRSRRLAHGKTVQ